MENTSLLFTLEERRRQAMLAGDLPTLRQLMADNMVYIHSSGSPDSKDSYLAKLADGSLKYLEVNFDGLQVLPLPQAAIVRGRMSAIISKDGQRKNVESVFMAIWSFGTDGTWRLHAHQGTPVVAS